MNIVLTARNVTINESLRQYTTKKIERLSRFFDHVQEARVVLRSGRDRNQGHESLVEVTVYGDGFVLRGEEAAPDFFAAVDLVAEKLERQIQKVRNRWIHKRRLDEIRRQRREEAEAEREQKAEEFVESLPRIVRRKQLTPKPITEEEAIIQMELLGHSFFVYRDADTGHVRVLYRRRDGHLGLLEVE
ncbi:MAG: ribosome-associated translation inhibitor RaiA [Armatimonadota bacterium]|nr:ribosome-associated translation inhibitor RaiA [Armatimonadota bacterium]MDR7439742.1 ribosome-associated translation inhibitor RaiA [Armatimonadota bacterium]MDR7563087.1 ribosome-associated translation inhibitor RaiA [Armatimonadota bacterium]MDR7566945.1 ribosome-associated translation inhibitor RaiA [Armatimonadota bacterium]MDR7600997.1 ribosome-associated translation inhibitor RaiA [Armatimonadota bacterium]